MADIYLPPKAAILLPRKRELIRPGDPRFQVKPPWHAMLMAGVTGLCGGGGSAGYAAVASGSFNGSNTALTRAYSTTSNRDTYTVSIWAKRGTTGSDQHLMGWSDGVSNSFGIKFTSGNSIDFYSYGSGYLHRQVTTATYTSTSAWMHILAANDTNNGTAGDRNRLWVDGTEVTSFSTDTQSGSGVDTQLNVTGCTYKIGNSGTTAGSEWFNGLMAEIAVVDGQQLDPTSFGQMDGSAWRPKSLSGLTFGTNGFWLRFANSGSLGDDSSGNGNNWTNSNVTQSSEVP